MRIMAAILSLTTLCTGAQTYASLVTHDEASDGDLPTVTGNVPGIGNLGTLDSGALIMGSLVGADTRDSIFFTSPSPFRITVESLSGSGLVAFGFGPAFSDFNQPAIGRSFFPAELLYDGIGSGDSSVGTPPGILAEGDYRIDFGPEGGELSSYRVIIAAVPEPSAFLGCSLIAMLSCAGYRMRNT